MAKIDLGEIGHFLTRNLTYGAGKETALISGSAINGAIGGSAAAVGVLGLTGALSAGLTQMDFIHKKNTIKTLYKEEIAAKLAKSQDKVTLKDLELLAQGDALKGIAANRTFSDELKKAKRIRNFGVVFSFMASFGSLLVVGALDPAMFAGMHKAIEAVSSGFIASAVEVITKGAIAIAAYNVIKAPIHWLGDKLFNLDRETTYSRIKVLKNDLEDGKTITQEQVLSIFVSANGQLEEMVVAKYGDRFDALSYPQKRGLVESFGALIDLKSLTDDINHGRIKPAELAFLAQGEASGVLPKDENPHEKHGLLKKIKHKLHHAIEHFNTPDFDGAEKKVVTREKAEEKEMKQMQATEHDNEPPKLSFVERFGRPRIATGLGHVQKLEQSRAEQPLATRS